MKLLSLKYKIHLLISAPKIDTDLLRHLSILFVGLAILYFLGIFFYRNRLSSTSKKIKERKRIFSPMISEFLFLEENATKDEKSNYIALKIEIRQLLKEPFNRKVLTELLLDLRKDISGEAQQSIFNLYQELGLHQDAFDKINSWQWHIISKGIIELTQMKVVEAYGFISNFINDKRSTIRKQAEIATVTLKPEGINYFLDTTNYRISEWQQLKILDVLRHKDDFIPPRFNIWLTSNNKYVVLFALRLIKFYNQNDANSSIIELVKHKNNQIKEEAIACIKEFNITESIKTLKMVFWHCSPHIKIAILDAIAMIGNNGDIEFLNLISTKELNYSVKSKALGVINTINPESIMPTKDIQKKTKYRVPEDIPEKTVEKYSKQHENYYGNNEDVLSEISFDKQEALNAGAIDNDDVSVENINKNSSIDISETQHQKSKNKVFDIEVVAEIITGTPIKNPTKPKAVDDSFQKININFLPIVTNEKEDPLNNLSENNNDKKDNQTKDIFDFTVVYEEIQATQISNDFNINFETEEDTLYQEEFEINDLTFLPIVVENDIKELHNTEENKNSTLWNISVDYEDVIKPLATPSTSKNNHKNVLDIEVEYEHVHNLNVLFDINITNLFNQYKTAEISQIKVIFDEVTINIEADDLNAIEVVAPHFIKIDEQLDDTFNDLEEINKIDFSIDNENINLDWDLDVEDLDFIPVSIENSNNQPPNYIRIETIQEKSMKIKPPKIEIPQPIFGDIEFEASTRQLLNDLEEMGDQRDIPFLNDLLNDKKYSEFNNWIDDLIKSFDDKNYREKTKIAIQPFNVFQDLFRTCDNESKLILLDLIVDLGGYKEIPFLEGLLNDESAEIAMKAFQVLNELQSKLEISAQEKEKITPSKLTDLNSIDLTEAKIQKIIQNAEQDDIFDLNFELKNENELEKPKDSKTVQYGSFFDQICSFSNKIIELING